MTDVKTYQIYSVAEYEHATEVLADSPEEAADIAYHRFHSIPQVSAALIDQGQLVVTERGTNGTVVRSWQLQDDGTMEEAQKVEPGNSREEEEGKWPM